MKKKCEWPGHAAAMDEAGFCSVCQEGEIDAEWAARNGVDLEQEIHLVEMYGVQDDTPRSS